MKAYNQWKTTLGLIQELKEHGESSKIAKRGQKKPAKSIASSTASTREKRKDEQSEKLGKMTKIERKVHYDKCKHTLQKTWDLVSEESSDDDG